MVEALVLPESRFDSGPSRADASRRLSRARRSMDQVAKLAVYQAQVTNVRALLTAMRQAQRSINSALRANNQPNVEAFTKVYALLFCAWTEANFSKVLHTPHGFDLDEIAQVQAAKENGIAAAWKKSVALGVRHLDATRGSFKPNAVKKLETIIDSHVFDPSLLRNKLAHGQWVIALNRENDALQAELTNQIRDLDVVKIDAWITCHKVLANAVETLIESPQKAFMRDWYAYVVEIDNAIESAEGRTLQEHVARLLDKDRRTNAKARRRGEIDTATGSIPAPLKQSS